MDRTVIDVLVVHEGDDLTAAVEKASLWVEGVRQGEELVASEGGRVGGDVRDAGEAVFVRWGCDALFFGFLALDGSGMGHREEERD